MKIISRFCHKFDVIVTISQKKTEKVLALLFNMTYNNTVAGKQRQKNVS